MTVCATLYSYLHKTRNFWEYTAKIHLNFRNTTANFPLNSRAHSKTACMYYEIAREFTEIQTNFLYAHMSFLKTFVDFALICANYPNL